MAALDILTYPDERLKTTCDAVDQFDAALREFIEHLQETCSGGPGAVGIAAPQVGDLRRICIVDATRAKRPVDNHGPLVLINPEITAWDGFAVGREGCLSVPDYTGKVIRAERIELKAQDPFGKSLRFTMHGFEARIAQHEVDHLDGILFLDRLVSRHADLQLRKK
ncbi:peptide deformylase [Halothiobacillus sp.]|uniref:peptide deformylase n=1 Tax=Halothiobacillus sp. TaxID=1891311 RepID=UPI002AD3A2C3|nr:peptide deformylase [Halothiobacillus sp.]